MERMKIVDRQRNEPQSQRMNRRERRAALRASEGLPSPEEGVTMNQWIDRKARMMAEHFGFEGERLERATRQAKNMLLVRLLRAGEGA